MNDLVVSNHENIGITDFNKVETELDAVIYRNEFYKHYQEYQNTKSEVSLIFSFIFLQIYVECFLHQYMRHIIGFEFMGPRDEVIDEWQKLERLKIKDKIERFCSLFFCPIPPKDIRDLIIDLIDAFSNLTMPRNSFVHGSKIASWASSHGTGTTNARSLLTEERIIKTIEIANKVGSIWNVLLEKVSTNFTCLGNFQDFKFSQLL